MRLINVKTLLLEEFSGRYIPRYAILSHTWAESSEEVEFKDIGSTDATCLRKAGWTKIKHLCQQAATMLIDWAWCDTCCIDKTSSAELSEAINSMFKWYQGSAVCYAYLSDISGVKHDQSIADQLARSKWFTRGWTLQELLAPTDVQFFDRDWKYLGDKQSLCADLCSITRVNSGAMTWSNALPSYSFGTRMSWASGRRTTRVEDQAYCLLGILGVHMPLLYGEGENAFRRLQEELIKVSDDETVFAHSGRNILATNSGDFADGLELTVLNKSHSAPFSITNAGLYINLRLLHLDDVSQDIFDSEVATFGILNCHHNNDADRDTYLAIPLLNTAIENTYRREPTGPRTVFASAATACKYQSIFVQLKPTQVSRMTLWEEFDESITSSRLLSTQSQVSYTNSKKELRIYPAWPYESELVPYSFEYVDGSSSPRKFAVKAFFDLVYNRAGILLLHDYDHVRDQTRLHRERSPMRLDDWKADENDIRLYTEATFSAWKAQGRPESAEFTIRSFLPQPGVRIDEFIRIAIVRKEPMRQLVWYLKVEVRRLKVDLPLKPKLDMRLGAMRALTLR